MLNEEGIGNKLITAAIIGMIGWVLINTNQLSKDVAVLQTQIETIDAVITIASSDRYTRAQAESDKALADSKTERLEEWVTNLSKRLSELENDFRDTQR